MAIRRARSSTRQYQTQREPYQRSFYESIYDTQERTQLERQSRKKGPVPQTIEIYEGEDNEVDKSRHTVANKLAGNGLDGYVDTIVNYNEDEGELNIANVVKIGDQYITKEWDCGKEYRETINRSRSPSKRSKGSKRSVSLKDTFDASRMTASKHLFNDEFEESVEPNPTFRSSTRKLKATNMHCDCDL